MKYNFKKNSKLAFICLVVMLLSSAVLKNISKSKNISYYEDKINSTITLSTMNESKNKDVENSVESTSGKEVEKIAYITIDDGPSKYTSQILDILDKHDVKATFFITAHYVNTKPELVQQMIDEGHIVGNHTVNHKSMPELTEEQIRTEIMDLHHVIYEKFGYEMKYMRPPKGEFSAETLKYTNTLGYKTVMWSFAYEDWNEEKLVYKKWEI